MRKWLIGLPVVLLLLLAAAYFLIPAQPVVSQFTVVGAGQNAVYRCLSDKSCLQAWWQDSNAKSHTSLATAPLQKEGFTFQFVPRLGNVVTASIQGEDILIQSSMAIFSIQTDSSAVEWKAALPPTSNIFKRWQQYLLAKKLKRQMASLMQRFQLFMADDIKVYGLSIQPSKVTDTMVITTSTMTDHYPEPKEYYYLIEKLKEYIAAHGAQETNYPMLNVSSVQDRYQARVAIPVNKVLPSGGEMAFKRLIPGHILIAEISGGNHAIENGLQQMENFVAEKGLSSPAIPFQSLVTNRMQEKDTTKWITRLYYPVY